MTTFGISRFLGILLVGFSVLAQANVGTPSAAPRDERAGSVARLLAGLQPTSPLHAAVAQSDEWLAHRNTVQLGWTRVKGGRGAAMVKWRDENLRAGCGASGTLLYPFSGPDFWNAYTFFPSCRNYVFFGLEMPGQVPEPEKLDAKALSRLLEDARYAFGDLLERNYFITSHMTRQLHTSQLRGVVPVLIATMALSGVDVLAVEPYNLAPSSEPVISDVPVARKKPMRDLRGVQITFQRPGASEVQTLRYFAVDATNHGLAPYPEFVHFLRGFKSSPMLIKAASYLLQDRQFALVRSTLLEAADYLVQDDTGMPFDVLKSAGWDVRLFGEYRKPKRPFYWAHQPGLQAAYKSAGSTVLPFPFSYHWGEAESNALIARRVPGQVIPTALRAPAPAPTR